MQTFEQFLAEAKDTQKDKVNNFQQTHDASHGDKEDKLKEDNKDYCGDHEFRESLNEALSGMDDKFIEANKDKSVGDKAVSATGKEMPFIVITNTDTTLFVAHKKGSTYGCIVYDKSNKSKAEVVINKDSFEQFKKLF